MKVMLWVPTANARPESWLQVEAYMATVLPPGVELKFKRSLPGNQSETWNRVVLDFLESDCEYLWSVHDDIVYHPDTLARLLSWEKPLVSGLVFMRQNPAMPHIWVKGDNGHHKQLIEETRDWFMKRERNILPGAQVIHPCPEDALVEVAYTSTSCTLIHRSVLERLREPMAEQWFLVRETGGGEDVRFFEYARAFGFIPYVDRSVICGHLFGIQPTGVMDFILWAKHPLFSGNNEGVIE